MISIAVGFMTGNKRGKILHCDGEYAAQIVGHIASVWI